MPVDLELLLDDLEAESAVVARMLESLDASDYERPTPAKGWAIRDQVSHLAHFDETATTALVDADRFRREADELMARGEDFANVLACDYRTMPSGELYDWFLRARRRLVEAYRDVDPRQRVPWYGPDMSAASCITARLMETWAHGQDIADALDVQREPTDRLRHIADLGVRTMAFSFMLHGLPAPEERVQVALRGPHGDPWTWHSEAAQRIEGTALDFCLVVTQRRSLDETGLEVEGETAQQWMTVAQAFAGPPGRGRTHATEGG